MKVRSKDEIETFFSDLYDGDLESQEIETTEDSVKVKVTRMYSFVPVDFKHLEKIGKFFETDKVNGSEGDYYEGCETCDYGSSYEVTFVIEKDEVKDE